jgi:hypothetical protein
MKYSVLILLLWASTLLASQPVIATTQPIDNWCVFKDAFGNPIPEADVAVFRDIKWSDETSKLLEISKLDKFGRLKPPSQDPNLYYCCFIVSHPDYGLALAEPRLYSLYSKASDLLTECIVPLVRIDSEAYKRSIFGFVTDTSGNPVTGAIITCSGVLTVDRARLVQDEPYYWNLFRTITDAQGHFTFYMPIINQGTLIPIPPGAKYNVIIIPPKGLGLSTLNSLLTSGKEAFIKLWSVIPSPKPQFIFEDEFGPISEPNLLELVRLEIITEQGPKKGFGSFSDWLKGKIFEPGTYHATADWNGKHYIFEPVRLTVDDVNETVVFKPAKILPLETIYRGQVVHGVTGQPIADALVMKYPTIHDFNLSDIDVDEQFWISKAILQIGPEFGPDDGLFELLTDDFKSKMIMQTSADGRFQIALPRGEIAPLHRIIAVKKDFLGARQELYFHIHDTADANSPTWMDYFTPDKDGFVTLPPLKLYPAATIIIEPITPQIGEGDKIKRAPRDLLLNWFEFTGQKPAWFEAMGDYTYPVKNSGASIFYKKDLLPNAVQKFYIASDLEMTLQIDAPVESQWDPIILPNIMLHQSEVLNLGRVEFGPAIKVAIMVVDSAGQAVEGVTVKQLNDKGKFWGRQSITDVDGIAFLDIPRYSTGEFAVEKQLGRAPDGSWLKPLRQGVPYQVAGQEDVGRVFTLQLSDDFLDILFE